MAGDARAFFADGLLRNLDQDFLAFLEQVGDQGKILLLVTARPASTTTTAAAAAALGPAIVSRTRRALGVTRGPRRSANFGAGFGHARAPGFGGQGGFGFRLGLIEFGFVFRFFVNFVGRRYIDLFRGNRFRGERYSVRR